MNRLMSASMIALAGAAGGAGAAYAQGMAEGPYECWFFSEPRPGLNFSVTGPSSYVGIESGEAGEYALAGEALTWVSGSMSGVMPDGFTTVYQVRQGNPTVSFVGKSGSEAAFCEKVK